MNIVLCGFPRSGTSLVMQMLRAGGVDLFYDADVRPKGGRRIAQPSYGTMLWMTASV